MNTANCLTLHNRNALRLVPSSYQIYYINARKCLYLYFRQKEDMRRMMKVFQQQNLKYSRRPGLLQTRTEYEDIVSHCQYRQKKKQNKFKTSKDPDNDDNKVVKQDINSQTNKQQKISQLKQPQDIIVDEQKQQRKKLTILKGKLKHILSNKALMNKLLTSFK